MALAQHDLFDGAGFPLATWNGVPITRGQRKATHRLSALDVHFGRDWKPAGKVPERLNGYVEAPLHKYGPRCLDIKNRGGTVAELMWEAWKKNPEEVRISGFLSFFNEFSSRPPSSQNFEKKGSMFGEVDFKGAQKYSQNQHRGQLSIEGDKGIDSGFGPFQFGVRWSKAALEWTRKNHGMVHMHLEGLGDIFNIIIRGGDNYSYNVSQRELRYVYRYRNTFEPLTCFYNGYDKEFNAIQVDCPW